ncbi:dephospho-CoA kinase [Kallipyga massiliensis]|uniref:dephospho-CoA kinase n=1 Tax=Kallipyga massiliensis TaxID=1472764 RepID=UPI0026F156C4|nr:dephospho-CoA kinase [Kallipyga massiliensis]
MKLNRTRRIGLTGGIASGKSSCTAYLIREGYRVLDGDKLAHRLMAPGQEAFQALVEAFGPGILDDEGLLDRGKLGDLVFQNPQALAKLNALTHPLIYRELEKEAVLAEEEGVKDGLLFFDLPLLFETWDRAKALAFDSIWLVVAPEDVRIRRMGERDGLTSEEARARIRAQMGDDQKIPKSDQIIYNERGLRALYENIQQALVLERNHHEIS